LLFHFRGSSTHYLDIPPIYGTNFRAIGVYKHTVLSTAVFAHNNRVICVAAGELWKRSARIYLISKNCNYTLGRNVNLKRAAHEHLRTHIYNFLPACEVVSVFQRVVYIILFVRLHNGKYIKQSVRNAASDCRRCV
jgi:hypothetical protein